MDRTVQWTEIASAQLDRAAAYIAADSPAYASAFVRRVRETASTLGRFPFRGRHVPELEGQELREVIISPYRLVYFVGDDTATVIALIHGARDFRKAFQNPEI